ncbi:MAG: molybdopterin-dependent oxidoreductase [Anaerolineales bacterium]
MKKLALFIILIAILTSCGSSPAQPTASVSEPVLKIIVGDNEQDFTVKDLQALPSAVSSFNGVDYMGVSVNVLLKEAGVNLNEVSAIKGVATDGYSVNYETAQLLPDDVLVAYSKADGSSLASDEGTFRMVLPDQEGKLNLRLLYKLVIVP